MIGKLRQWSLTQASYFGVAAVVLLGNPGYLPIIGPAPLRLAPLIHIDTNAPIKFDPPAPKVESVEPPKTEPQPTPIKMQNAGTNAPVVPLVAAPVTNAPAPAPTVPPAPSDQIISPQMFLKYFNSTPAKGSGTSVEFTPPQTTAAASSPSTPTPPTTQP